MNVACVLILRENLLTIAISQVFWMRVWVLRVRKRKEKSRQFSDEKERSSSIFEWKCWYCRNFSFESWLHFHFWTFNSHIIIYDNESSCETTSEALLQRNIILWISFDSSFSLHSCLFLIIWKSVKEAAKVWPDVSFFVLTWRKIETKKEVTTSATAVFWTQKCSQQLKILFHQIWSETERLIHACLIWLAHPIFWRHFVLPSFKKILSSLDPRHHLSICQKNVTQCSHQHLCHLRSGKIWNLIFINVFVVCLSISGRWTLCQEGSFRKSILRFDLLHHQSVC